METFSALLVFVWGILRWPVNSPHQQELLTTNLDLEIWYEVFALSHGSYYITDIGQ